MVTPLESTTLDLAVNKVNAADEEFERNLKKIQASEGNLEELIKPDEKLRLFTKKGWGIPFHEVALRT